MRVLDAQILEQPPPVRLALLEVLHYQMHVDGILDEREAEVIDDLCSRLGLEELKQLLPEQPAWKKAWGDLLAPIARLTLMQAAILSVADGVVHRSERVSLERLALALDQDAAALDAILAWAEEGREWLTRGEALLAEV